MTAACTRRDVLKRSALIMAGAAVGLRPVFASSQASPVVAHTTHGRIRGVEVSGIKVFKGVPYGAAPRAGTGSCHRLHPSHGLAFATRLSTDRVRRRANPASGGLPPLWLSPPPACPLKAKTVWCSTSGRPR